MSGADGAYARVDGAVVEVINLGEVLLLLLLRSSEVINLGEVLLLLGEVLLLLLLQLLQPG